MSRDFIARPINSTVDAAQALLDVARAKAAASTIKAGQASHENLAKATREIWVERPGNQ